MPVRPVRPLSSSADAVRGRCGQSRRYCMRWAKILGIATAFAAPPSRPEWRSRRPLTSDARKARATSRQTMRVAPSSRMLLILLVALTPPAILRSVAGLRSRLRTHPGSLP